MSYSTFGMNTLQAEPVKLAKLIGVAFVGDMLTLQLSDGRILQLRMNDHAWLKWLQEATNEQRQSWEIMPSGGGVWWQELDNGVELQPLLDTQSLI
ncbi:MAG: DUF2442 domain-containing protein [Anaerolineae bacterium]|nr:DUF2442 domain-containing protein [Anaerolineae bacterium]MCB9130462.1 DUF2442 domain-containing protein [Anaerolineales bacterium]MCB0229403.1 DUF2442 domain-containing protein [Anaerolineae bacterium]MCB0235505.1 DUF2442 domain-containing protein [Anaerolineae bacterium]MCB0238008.1 DUF2442 domain-containing protein [Anaerolineae bacterium]